MAAVLLPSKHLKGIDHAPKAYPFESHKTGGGHFVGKRWVNTQPETGKTFKKFAPDASYDPEKERSFNAPRHSEVERQRHIINDWKGGGSLFPSGQHGGSLRSSGQPLVPSVGWQFPSGQQGKSGGWSFDGPGGRRGIGLYPSGQQGKSGGWAFDPDPHGAGLHNCGAFLGSDGMVHHGSNVSTGGGIRKKQSRKRGGMFGATRLPTGFNVPPEKQWCNLSPAERLRTVQENGGGIRKKRSRKRGGAFVPPGRGAPVPLSASDRARNNWNFQMMQNC